MTEALRQLCGLSLFCGIALGLMPEGGVKKRPPLPVPLCW